MEEKNPFPEEINSERFAGNKGMENIDLMPILSGIDAGGIVEIKTCKEVIEEMVFGAKELFEKSEDFLK
jgi:hypothetical protein